MIEDSGMAAALAAGLDDAKSYARIESGDDDDGVTALLVAAGGVAEGFLSQAIIIRGFEETIPAVSQWRRLARTPVRAITAVQGLAVEGAAFDLPVDAYAIDIDADGDGWVRVSDPGAATRIAVTYQAGIAPGWAGLPDMIRQGIIRLVAHLHAHRDARDDGGPPIAVAALWRPWRRMRLR
jgi:uncharacterized phiE125 gp8 family phage protein